MHVLPSTSQHICQFLAERLGADELKNGYCQIVEVFIAPGYRDREMHPGRMEHAAEGRWGGDIDVYLCGGHRMYNLKPGGHHLLLADGVFEDDVVGAGSDLGQVKRRVQLLRPNAVVADGFVGETGTVAKADGERAVEINAVDFDGAVAGGAALAEIGTEDEKLAWGRQICPDDELSKLARLPVIAPGDRENEIGARLGIWNYDPLIGGERVAGALVIRAP